MAGRESLQPWLQTQQEVPREDLLLLLLLLLLLEDHERFVGSTGLRTTCLILHEGFLGLMVASSVSKK